MQPLQFCRGRPPCNFTCAGAGRHTWLGRWRLAGGYAPARGRHARSRGAARARARARAAPCLPFLSGERDQRYRNAPLRFARALSCAGRGARHADAWPCRVFALALVGATKAFAPSAALPCVRARRALHSAPSQARQPARPRAWRMQENPRNPAPTGEEGAPWDQVSRPFALLGSDSLCSCACCCHRDLQLGEWAPACPRAAGTPGGEVGFPWLKLRCRGAAA